MSRTYKDRPARIRHPDMFDRNDENKWDRVPYEAEGYRYYYNTYYNETRYYYVKKPGVIQKKKKREDTEWRWMSTPGWWTHMAMDVPQRVASKQWERVVVKERIDAIYDETFDEAPIIGRKPHLYFW